MTAFPRATTTEIAIVNATTASITIEIAIIVIRATTAVATAAMATITIATISTTIRMAVATLVATIATNHVAAVLADRIEIMIATMMGSTAEISCLWAAKSWRRVLSAI